MINPIVTAIGQIEMETQVLRLRGNGHSYAMIANKLGRGKAQIARYCRVYEQYGPNAFAGARR